MKPVPTSPEIAALRFFDRWIRDEAILHTSLQGGSPEEQRLAIGRTVTHFRVVRSLKRSAEEALGVPRFEPVRECLATVTVQEVSDDEFVAVTTEVARAIASRYGGHSFLSLASKILWMKYRHPFVIYDSIVRAALGTRSADYHTYVVAWHEQYSLHEGAIRRACAGLASSRHPLRTRLNVPAQAITPIASEEWFRRRVMDFMFLDGA
jgi:hypothetical protein